MADLFWLCEGADPQDLALLPALARRALDRCSGSSAASCTSSATGCAGAMHRPSTGRTRPSTTALCDGAAWACSTAIFVGFAGRAGEPERLMIDATHLKAHRTAASLLKKGLFPAVSGAPRAA